MTHSIKTKFVGLDVHKDTIVIAVAEVGPGGGAGDRDGASRMEGLEKGARQARAAFGGSLLLRGRADRLRPGPSPASPRVGPAT